MIFKTMIIIFRITNELKYQQILTKYDLLFPRNCLFLMQKISLEKYKNLLLNTNKIIFASRKLIYVKYLSNNFTRIFSYEHNQINLGEIKIYLYLFLALLVI